jgi:Holliday junction DNA helicase RuvB
LQLELPPFTLIAATTRIAMLSAPLRSRFSGGVYRLEMYSLDEISTIAKKSSQILEIKPNTDALTEIAKRSRQTPRTANYFLKRIRDYAHVHKSEINQDSTQKALDLLGVDHAGFK